jgi:hypothetical protein
MRWGIPPPPRNGGPPVTNIRNTASETKKKDVVWFALNDDRPLFAFGGIWIEFKGDGGTKSKPIPGPHLVYDFPDDHAERDNRADPSQSHAGDPDNARGMRRLDARAVGRSEIVAATIAR